MNSGTTLKYNADFMSDRHVQLEGEAFFEVYPGKGVLKVEASQATVRVLGTQFNVKAYSLNPVYTTLLNGSVEVSNKNHTTIISPNQQAVINNGDDSLVIKNVNASIYASWITGEFEFRKVRLETIMEQLSLWYDMNIEFIDNSLRDKQFTGSIYKERPLEYSLQIIEDISEVTFTKRKNKLEVSN